MADALGSGLSRFTPIGVQLPSSASPPRPSGRGGNLKSQTPNSKQTRSTKARGAREVLSPKSRMTIEARSPNDPGPNQAAQLRLDLLTSASAETPPPRPGDIWGSGRESVLQGHSILVFAKMSFRRVERRGISPVDGAELAQACRRVEIPRCVWLRQRRNGWNDGRSDILHL